MKEYFKQKTLASVLSVKGVGLHKGEVVHLTIHPAPVNSGIKFVRTDLSSKPSIDLKASNICPTPLCTTLFNETGDSVATIEHLLAAFASKGINNALIELDSSEIPILDGSSMPWLILLEDAGICEQIADRQFIVINKHVRVEEGDKWAEVIPASQQVIDFTIQFDHPAIKDSQSSMCFSLSSASFRKIASARTFGFMKDVEQMRANNLALGGSMDNAVVLDEYRVLNPSGLRHPDEFIQHKVLDAVGDLFAHGEIVLGHFNLHKSGHALNNALLKAVLTDPSCYSILSLNKEKSTHKNKLYEFKPALI